MTTTITEFGKEDPEESHSPRGPVPTEPSWVAAIPDDGDREAVRAVLQRRRWALEHGPRTAWDVP